MQSHMWLGGPAGHLGTVEEHEVQMVSYNKPLSSTSSFLSSSYCFPILLTLQFPPTSSLPAFLAAIFNADQATSWRHSSPPLWLFIPSNHAFVPFPLRLLLLIVIRGSWVFILYDGVKRVSWAALPIEEQHANCGQSLSIIPPIRLCVCVCALVLDQRRLRGLSVCIFCANNFWLILNYGWCWTPCRHKGMFTPTKTVWGSRWRLSQSIFVFHPRAISLQYECVLIVHRPFAGPHGCVTWQRPPFLSFPLTFFCSFLQESDGAAVVSALRFHPVTHCFSALLCLMYL